MSHQRIRHKQTTHVKTGRYSQTVGIQRGVYILKTIDQIVNELKEVNQVIDGVIVALRGLQNKKLSKTATDEELAEYHTIKEIVQSLQSVA